MEDLDVSEDNSSTPAETGSKGAMMTGNDAVDAFLAMHRSSTAAQCRRALDGLGIPVGRCPVFLLLRSEGRAHGARGLALTPFCRSFTGKSRLVGEGAVVCSRWKGIECQS